MSLLRDYQFRELTAFGGAWLLPDATIVTTQGALLAKNVEYIAGQVGTRTGYAPLTIATVSVLAPTQMYAWYAPFSSAFAAAADVALAWFSPGAVEVVDLAMTVGLGFSQGVPTTGTPVSASFVGVGMRLYVVYHDARQRGAGDYGQIFVIQNPATGTSDIMFAGPIITVPTTSEPGAGVVTAGVHRLGYLLEYIGGFTTRVSPDSGALSTPTLNTFTPVSVTAAGSKNLQVVINPTGGWPYAIAAVSLVMTTTTNLNQYYIVPGSRTLVANSGAGSKTITIDISDADLSSQGIDATPYLYWLTTSVNQRGGTGPTVVPPFKPSHICLFGDRMAYKGYQTDNLGSKVDCLYVSERNNYQAITADQHLVMLPGQRDITTMFQMGGTNYLVGPHEIYATTDTGDVPVTWPAPHLVDGRTGTLAVHGVEVAPSGQYAWIADQGGLFLFNGSPITALPVSYYQSNDWNRINWGVAYTIQVKDDAANKRVYVAVALDAATTPSHIMVFDYTDGATFDTVRYSLDNITGFTLGAMELIRNELAGQVAGNKRKVELWVGSNSGTSTTDTFRRKKSTLDTTPYRDGASTAITSTYRTCPLPGRDRAGGVISMHHGFHARLTGAGLIAPILYDIDAQRGYAGRQATLATLPDADILFLMDLRNELAVIEFSTSAADTHWHLAYLKYYYSPYLMQR